MAIIIWSIISSLSIIFLYFLFAQLQFIFRLKGAHLGWLTHQKWLRQHPRQVHYSLFIFPFIYILVSKVKIEWRNIPPALARGAAAGVRPWCEAAACLSERCWHLVSGVTPLPAEAARTAAPSAHLVSAFGRLLSRCCLDGSSFRGSNRWAWRCCCCRCPDAGRKHASELVLMHVDVLSKWRRTSITVNTGAAIAALCFLFFFFFAVGTWNQATSSYSYTIRVCVFGRFGEKVEKMQYKILILEPAGKNKNNKTSKILQRDAARHRSRCHCNRKYWLLSSMQLLHG